MKPPPRCTPGGGSGVSDFGSETETGFGALLGLGWDIRVGKNVSLTPFWNGFSANTYDLDATLVR